MCQICEAFNNGEMTASEALAAAGISLVLAKTKTEIDHCMSVVDHVMAKEVPFSETDPEMDAIYEKELKG